MLHKMIHGSCSVFMSHEVVDSDIRLPEGHSGSPQVVYQS